MALPYRPTSIVGVPTTVMALVNAASGIVFPCIASKGQMEISLSRMFVAAEPTNATDKTARGIKTLLRMDEFIFERRVIRDR
jgi:hypothetical protein